jgi:PAS domain S-box-containing protein
MLLFPAERRQPVVDGTTRGHTIPSTSEPDDVRLERELALRARLEQRLERTEQQLRLGLQISHMATWEYDLAARQFHCQGDLEWVTGTSLQTLNGSFTDVLQRVHPDDRARVERSAREAVARGEELYIEARIVQEPTRRVRWLVAAGVLERDADGRPVRIVGIARDVTDRKEAEAARHARAQGERLRALGEMASGIAHDLNQSLALITGYSDMARQELSLEAPDLHRTREMVEITGQAAIEGGHALRGLLSFVRSQELMAEAGRVELAELLHDVARLTAPRWRDAPQAEGRPISLTVDVEPGCAVSGSAPALREAITNLIFNAVDALPHGGSIGLSARRTNDRVTLEVRDTGTGIPQEVRSRIFDPFFTTKGEHGTGLGLPQVLTIVERHAGAVDVDSEPGRGTTFKLTFPASTNAATEETELSIVRAVPAAKVSLRVLVVEDEDQLARMACLVLTQRGHRASIAASGDEALAYLEEERFDLVISDLGLGPGKNGWDVAEAVRQRWTDTRFVLVTGWGAAIDLTEARARGVDRVIAKPYRIAELREIADDVAAGVCNS